LKHAGTCALASPALVRDNVSWNLRKHAVELSKLQHSATIGRDTFERHSFNSTPMPGLAIGRESVSPINTSSLPNDGIFLLWHRDFNL
jgi:hypothetical protein